MNDNNETDNVSTFKETNSFRGVKEGNSHLYDFEDVKFAYCSRPVNLYTIEEGVNDLEFIDFVKPTSHHLPRSNRGLLDHQIVDNLMKQGIQNMRPIQIAALQAVFFTTSHSQHPPDFLGISTTGSGKTHAFLVPVLQKCLDNVSPRVKPKPIALIFAHSNALVENIYQKALDMVKNTGVVVRIIAGQQPWLSDTNFHIGICSIGRFSNHIYPDMHGVKIHLNDLQYVVIDEADKMAELPEFFPIYRRLKEKAHFSTMLFSATNNASVKAFLDPYNHYTFCYGTPNTVATSIRQKFWHVKSKSFSHVFGAMRKEVYVAPYEPGENPHPFDAIYCLLEREIVQRKKDIHVVIFVKRTIVADIVALRLTHYGIPTVSVHSNQKAENRKRCLQYFMDGEVKVMTATNLLTRGTDIQVDYVINYDLPLEYKEYIHRCGRTGRNQQDGVAITCVDFDNHDDYSPTVLRQIALSLIQKNERIPSFMAEFAENARKIHEVETDA